MRHGPPRSGRRCGARVFRRERQFAHMPKKSLNKRIKRACVFAGPSLVGHTLPSNIERLPPATRGALNDAIRSGYTHIGFIDGAVEERERLPLRELRKALATPEVMVLGGASMGAVRAVQLESDGMRGHGRVFRLFRRGSLTDSDEVYVLHAPATLHYRCLTIPLVNIRYTVRAMRLAGHLSREEEHALIKYMRDVPWFDRDRHSLSAATFAMCGSSRSARVMQAFDLLYRDIKREDALSLVARLHSPNTPLARSKDLAPMEIRSRALRRT
jgi:TfuA protein